MLPVDKSFASRLHSDTEGEVNAVCALCVCHDCLHKANCGLEEYGSGCEECRPFDNPDAGRTVCEWKADAPMPDTKRDIAADRAMWEATTQGEWAVCMGSGMNLCTAIYAYNENNEMVMIADCLPDYFLQPPEVAPKDHVPNMKWICEAHEAYPHYLTRTASAEARVATVEADNAKLQRKVERLTRYLGTADFTCPSKTTCPWTLNSDPPKDACIACWNEWAEKEEEKHE